MVVEAILHGGGEREGVLVPRLCEEFRVVGVESRNDRVVENPSEVNFRFLELGARHIVLEPLEPDEVERVLPAPFLLGLLA